MGRRKRQNKNCLLYAQIVYNPLPEGIVALFSVIFSPYITFSLLYPRGPLLNWESPNNASGLGAGRPGTITARHDWPSVR